MTVLGDYNICYAFIISFNNKKKYWFIFQLLVSAMQLQLIFKQIWRNWGKGEKNEIAVNNIQKIIFDKK